MIDDIAFRMDAIIADVRRLAQHAPRRPIVREPAPPAESWADSTRRFWVAYNSLSPADQASYRRYLGMEPSPPAADSFTRILGTTSPPKENNLAWLTGRKD